MTQLKKSLDSRHSKVPVLHTLQVLRDNLSFEVIVCLIVLQLFFFVFAF